MILPALWAIIFGWTILKFCYFLDNLEAARLARKRALNGRITG